MERATGVPSETAHGRPIASLFPEIETRGFLTRFRSVIETGAVQALAPAFHHYLIACRPSYESKRFQHMQQRVTIAPLKEGDRIAGTMVFIEDVTESLETDDPKARRETTGWLAKNTDEQMVHDLIQSIRKQHRNASILNSTISILAQAGWDTTPALGELTRDPDPEVRMYAALTLGERNDPRGTAYLIDMLGDESVNVRYHAVEAIGRLKAPDAVEALVDLAQSADFFLAFPAIDALAAIGDRRVTPALISLLDNDAVAPAAIDALGRLGDAYCVEPLVRLLDNPSAAVEPIASAVAAIHERYEALLNEGQHVADVASRTISAQGVQRLLDSIDSVGGQSLPALAKLLGWIDGAGVEEALTRLMALPAVRKEAIAALTRTGERVSNLLIGQLDSDDAEVRRAAVVALGRIGDSRAVPALLHVLSEEEDLAVPAADSLAKIGDRRAHDALVDLLGHPKAVIRRAVIGAINSLGHPDTGKKAFELLSHPNPLLRESAVRIAGYFGYPECTDKLFQCTSDVEENVRKAAVEHLPYIDDPRVMPLLEHCLRRGAASVRAASAIALGQMDDADAGRILIDALADEDPWVRYYAVRSLGRLKCEDAVPGLEQALDDDAAGHVRIAAAEALGHIGGSRAVARLISAMESGNPDIVRVASLALASLAVPEALEPLLQTLKSEDAAGKTDAIRALSVAGGKQAVEALEWVAATEEEPRLRKTAVEELARMESPESITALTRMAADRRLNSLCVAALSGLKPQRIEWVAKGLGHHQVEVRQAVIEALGRMKHPLASEFLAKALDDKDATVRLNAVAALDTLGSRSSDRKLIELAHKDSDPSVRETARRTVERVNTGQ
jgi:HEAT repeat protein